MKKLLSLLFVLLLSSPLAAGPFEGWWQMMVEGGINDQDNLEIRGVWEQEDYVIEVYARDTDYKEPFFIPTGEGPLLRYNGGVEFDVTLAVEPFRSRHGPVVRYVRRSRFDDSWFVGWRMWTRGE